MTQLKTRALKVPIDEIVDAIINFKDKVVAPDRVWKITNSVIGGGDYVNVNDYGAQIYFDGRLYVLSVDRDRRIWRFFPHAYISARKSTKGDTDIFKFMGLLLEAIRAPFRYVNHPKMGLCINFTDPAFKDADPIPLQDPLVTMTEREDGSRAVNYAIRSYGASMVVPGTDYPRLVARV